MTNKIYRKCYKDERKGIGKMQLDYDTTEKKYENYRSNVFITLRDKSLLA